MNTEEFLEQQKRIMIDAINETSNKNPTEGLRDYFAGLAMQAILADDHYDYVARVAYSMADAMLEERERRE